MTDLHAMTQALDDALEEASQAPGGPSNHPGLGQALNAFAGLSSPELAPELVDMLGHDVQLHHQAGLLGLLAIGQQSVDALDAALVNPKTAPAKLERVAQSMFFMSDMWCFERVFEVCGHAQTMEWMGSWLDIQQGVSLADDAGTRVLLTLGSEAAGLVRQAISELPEHTPQTDLGAISALVVQVHTPEGWELAQQIMARALHDEERFAVVRRGLLVLARAPHERAAPAIASWLDSVHHYAASAVLADLGDSGVTHVLPLVESWAHDDTRRDRRASAARVLTSVVTPDSTRALASLATDPDLLIKHMSWYALARRGEALEMLVDRARHADELDRMEAREALSQCPAPQAREALSEILAQTQDAYDRAEIEELIGVWDAAFADTP